MATWRERGGTARWETFPWSMLGADWYYRRVALVASARHLATVRSAKEQAAVLSGSPQSAARRLGKVAEAVSGVRVTDQTRTALARIEHARRRLLHSEATVVWTGGREAPAAWVCALASQPAVGARLLFHCVDVWRPETALELGTCVGVSAAYQAYGQVGVPGARFTTVEGYAGLAAEARMLLRDAGLDGVTCVVGMFDDALPGILEAHPLDYAYVDGHHDRDATLRYFESIRAHCNPGALLVFDDIDYSPGMVQAWTMICQSDNVAATARLGKIGLAVLH